MSPPSPAAERTAHRGPTWATRGATGAGLRFGVAAAAALAAAQVHDHADPGVLCPLRRFTGVPCPFCGSTTVFMQTGAGHWGGAVAANPFTVVAVLGLLLYPLFAAEALGFWNRMPRRLRWTLGAAVLSASWLWQLHRFGLL
jgi:Protein of unknown function (DUF2752)